MSWCSINEYSQRSGQAASTIRRNIQKGRLYGRKFGRSWFVFEEDEKAPPMTSAVAATDDFPALTPDASASSLQGLLDFSSKALHHYLLMHDKLMAEKDLRLREKEEVLQRIEQDKAELEGYARILETALKQSEVGAKGAD